MARTLAPLTPPTRLYGREALELTAVDTFEGIRDGRGAELLCVVGEPGSGKTSLARQLLVRLSAQGARGVWLSCVEGLVGPLQALQELVSSVLVLDSCWQQRWREALLEATQGQAKLLGEAVPALAELLGAPAPAPKLDVGADRRAMLALERSFRAFAAANERPLVLVADDLSSADEELLALLGRLMDDADRGGALMIVATVEPAALLGGGGLQQLVSAQRSLERATTVSLEPLKPHELRALLAEAEDIEDDGSFEQASEVLADKTRGNPMKLRVLLGALVAEEGRVPSEPEALAPRVVAADLDTFLATELQGLSAAVRGVLELVALLNTEASLQTVEALSNLPGCELAEALDEALVRGLLLEGDALLQLLTFPSERLRRIALARQSRKDRERLRSAQGRRLLEVVPSEDLVDGARLLGVCEFIAAVAPEELDGVQSQRAARILSAGARYAADVGRPELAATWQRSALAHSTPVEEPLFAFDLRCELAESLIAVAALEEAQEVLEGGLAKARLPWQRAKLTRLRVHLHIHQGEMTAAMERGLKVLREDLGCDIPEDPRVRAELLDERLQAVVERLGAAPLADLLDLPEVVDPRVLAEQELLAALNPAAYQVDRGLFAFLALHMVDLCLDHGNAAVSCRAYQTLAIVLVGTGAVELGYRLGALAVELESRQAHPSYRSSVKFEFGAFVACWVRPLPEVYQLMDEAAVEGFETGDYVHMGYNAAVGALLGFQHGPPLAELADRVAYWHGRALEVNEGVSSRNLAVFAQLIEALREREPTPGNLWRDPEAVQAQLQRLTEAKNLSQRFHFEHLELQHLYLGGRYTAARRVGERAAALIPEVDGLYSMAQFFLYRGLALSAPVRRYGELSPSAQRVFKECRERLAELAAAAPDNLGPANTLLEAERARIMGDHLWAMEAYDQAIEATRDVKDWCLAAVASERAGVFWRGEGKRSFTFAYLRMAHQLFARWGAWAIVARLERDHPELAPLLSPLTSVGAVDADSDAVALVLDAARAIAEHLEPEPLMTLAVDKAVTCAGAQRGVLLVTEEGHWSPRAHVAEQGAAPVLRGETASFASSVVRHVAEQGDSVLIAHAESNALCVNDLHVRRHRPKAILCVPCVYREEVQAMLYLEDDLLADAFTPTRRDAMELLASHVARAMYNAGRFAAERARVAVLEEKVRELEARLSTAGRRPHGS